MPEFMHYDDDPPSPWREFLIDLGIRLAMTAALAAALFIMAAYEGVL